MDTSALPRPGRVIRAAVATGLTALLFTACSAASETEGSAVGQSAPENTGPAAPEERSGSLPGEAEAADTGGEAGHEGAAPESGAADRELVHTAEMTVRVDDVDEAAGLAKAMTLEADGYVARESLSTPASGTPRGTLTLRVPSEGYESALEGLAELGERSSLERSVEDVTEEVADAESRIASSEAALETLRGYLEAAEDVDDLLRVEGEIQQRQESLEAFQARLESLRDQTSYSTVHLTLVPPATYLEQPPQESPGFLGGLERGWLALVMLGQGLAAAVGWLLPFAVVGAVLGAGPLWLWRRRRQTRRRDTGAPGAADSEPEGPESKSTQEN